MRVAISDPGEPIEEPPATGLTGFTMDLEPAGGGWWRADVAEAAGALPGREYGFLLDDNERVLPNPRSRWQPRGVHQPSRFYADDFAWTDAGWPGHDLLEGSSQPTLDKHQFEG